MQKDKAQVDIAAWIRATGTLTGATAAVAPPAIDINVGDIYEHPESGEWEVVDTKLGLGFVCLKPVSYPGELWWGSPNRLEPGMIHKGPRAVPGCECGAEKCKTTHSRWCPKF